MSGFMKDIIDIEQIKQHSFLEQESFVSSLRDKWKALSATWSWRDFVSGRSTKTMRAVQKGAELITSGLTGLFGAAFAASLLFPGVGPLVAALGVCVAIGLGVSIGCDIAMNGDATARSFGVLLACPINFVQGFLLPLALILRPIMKSALNSFKGDGSYFGNRGDGFAVAPLINDAKDGVRDFIQDCSICVSKLFSWSPDSGSGNSPGNKK